MGERQRSVPEQGRMLWEAATGAATMKRRLRAGAVRQRGERGERGLATAKQTATAVAPMCLPQVSIQA